MQKIKPTFAPGQRTLIYDDLKGKVFSQVRVFQVGRVTSVVLVFEDKTTFNISVEPKPMVRLSVYDDEDGDLEEIAVSGKIPVPRTSKPYGEGTGTPNWLAGSAEVGAATQRVKVDTSSPAGY